MARREKWKTVIIFLVTKITADGDCSNEIKIRLVSKITADGDCSNEIKIRLLLERKAMTNLDSILQSRDITLLTKGTYSQSYGFSSGHGRM